MADNRPTDLLQPPEFFFENRGITDQWPSLADRIEVQGDCWVWVGWSDEKGYGRIQENGKRQGAHRFIYERLVGPIPEGLDLDHLCVNPPCVNPDHLEPVTPRINTKRARGSTHERCKRGHVGFYRTYNDKGYRRCYACPWNMGRGIPSGLENDV